MVSIAATQQKNNLLSVSEPTFPKIEVHNSQEMVSAAEYQRILSANQKLQRLLQKERTEKREWEQKYRRIRDIAYNNKWEKQERIDTIAILDAEENGRVKDSSGRTRINMGKLAERIGTDNKTLKKTRDMLEQAGLIKCVDAQIKENGDERKRVYIESNKEKSLASLDRPEPRKIKEDRKKYTYRCQTCLEIGTVEKSKHLVCTNTNCTECGKKKLIEVSYDEQLEARKEEGDTGNFSPIPADDNFQAEDTGKFPPILESNSIRPESFRPSDDSNNPPCASSATILQEWLSKRRGTPRIIWATGSTQSDNKYLSKGANYQPDLDAFIAGKIGHIYGSWLRNSDGKTSVLCFEIDQPEHNDQVQDYMLSLARAGAAPIYWKRQRQRGHLEIYFDRPVDPEVARLWALEICPELEDIPECYPCLDKKNNALSWPLYQRIGGEVFPCTAYAILPAPHEAGMQEVDPTDLEKLAQLVTIAVTPAALIEEYAVVLAKCQREREQKKEARDGGVIGKKPSVITQVGSNRDLVKQVIADFNRDHSWEEIAALCGGMREGKFCAIWRGERTPSVAVNRDGVLAHDYGKSGGFLSTFDQYQAYCLIHGIDKKADLAERCAALRSQQQPVDNTSEEPTTELFLTEKPQDIYGVTSGTDNHVPVSLEAFWGVGKKHSYPEIPDLDLKGGMSGWNSFSLAHRLQIPDVIARLGSVD